MLTITTTLLALLPQGVQKPVPHKGSLLIEAARIYIDKDRVLTDSAILVRDGKVLYVGEEIPGDARKGAKRLDLKKSTVVPGFVNAHSSLGHGAQLAERIDAFTPELQASDAFDPFAAPVHASARAGVTTVGLAPSSFNAFAGQAAAIRTGRIGTMLQDSSYLKMAMVDAAFDQNRFPTSRMGAADLIRSSFTDAKAGVAGDERLKLLAEIAAGNRSVAFHAQTEAEINAVLDLAAELELKPILLGADQGSKCVDRIAKICAGVVLAPLGFGSDEKRLRLPAALEKRGVPFSFMAERPEDLRVTAALAVRYGASKKAVLAALTETAARHLGVQDTVGTLFEGRSADFAVFSGDPLDLTSRLEHVFIAGMRVALPQAAETPKK